MIDQAMVLAAGLGRRMRPLTERTAKPLLPLAGQTLLDHALDRLDAAGVRRVVVNTHWQADLVQRHLLARRAGPQVAFRPEATLLDTGGAVAAALADGMLAQAPFYVVNGDTFWLDGPTPTLARMAAAFDPALTRGVLLLHRTHQAHGEVGRGDFALDPSGKPRRRREREVLPYVYAGVQLATPALFADPPQSPFSATVPWDRAIAAGRLRAVVHDGLWFHLTRPEDLFTAEGALHNNETGGTR